MKPRTFLESANLAVEGILHAARTQKHMRYHLLAAGGVLIVSLLLGVTQIEFLILIFIILLVLLSEMFNTAIEAVVDIISPEYNHLAKIAKDVAAGAVFLASVGAVITGYIILYPYIKDPFRETVLYIKNLPEHLTVIGLILVVIAVVLTKAYGKRGRPFYGGLPSGHSAVSFAISTIITLLTANALISILTFILASMVACSRVSLGIHTFWEVAVGALIGIVIILFIFQLFG